VLPDDPARETDARREKFLSEINVIWAAQSPPEK
jgi:hypothetical protein